MMQQRRSGDTWQAMAGSRVYSSVSSRWIPSSSRPARQQFISHPVVVSRRPWSQPGYQTADLELKHTDTVDIVERATYAVRFPVSRIDAVWLALATEMEFRPLEIAPQTGQSATAWRWRGDIDTHERDSRFQDPRAISMKATACHRPMMLNTCVFYPHRQANLEALSSPWD
jgi:hypothetical protein